jgi:hypothetical protein
MMFDKNPRREFFVEEGCAIKWMYPYLEPHGLIFKLNRQPAAMLSDEIVQRDHEYWTKYIQPMIGNWLKDETSVAEVATFAEKTYGRQDFSRFAGDPRFVQNGYSQKMYSKLRSAMAGLYEWRANHATDATDQQHMLREADFAFRQAWVLGPDALETEYRYVNFLAAQSRGRDALRVAETAEDISRMKGRDATQYEDVVKWLKEHPGQGPAANQ